ncbi:MAG: hypothetical protein BWZ10_02591 [candidate division BRC1 bacterium ADurb.BinA364]|nr:MAG: hypothetical protein BWZ10_02591 [candidate division BRC1 bacterium ADurb.BinA364]
MVQKLDSPVPLELEFVDEYGQTHALRDYFDGKRPVILTLNYYKCPLLCTLQLNGLIAALKQLQWTPGQEFEIVTVSINPRETPQLAQLKEQSYIQEYERPSAAAGWHFMTGRQEAIAALAEQVGFLYEYDAESDQYSHPAVTMICTPDGRLSRYLFGIEYDPTTLKLSLMEAADGKIGSLMDKIILSCFHFDATRGRYGPQALGLMRAGGAITLIALGVPLLIFWRRERRRAHSDKQDA